MNSIQICGKIVEEPVVGTSSNDLKFAKIKIAVDKKGTNNEPEYEIFEVVVFRTLAELQFDIGQYIGVVGRLSANNFEKDGNVYYNCSIIGNSLSFFGR